MQSISSTGTAVSLPDLPNPRFFLTQTPSLASARSAGVHSDARLTTADGRADRLLSGYTGHGSVMTTYTAAAATELPAPTVVERQHEDPATGKVITSWHSNAPSDWTLYRGQAADALRLIDQASVDCVVTSPPYFWLRDYQVDGQIGLEDTVEEYVSAITSVMREVLRVLKPSGTLFLNLGDTYYSGKGKSHGVDKKSSKRRFGLRAVDKSGGLGIGLKRKSVIGIPWRVAIEMSQSDWVLRSPIIWNRLKLLPENVRDRPAKGYEYIFLFVKNRHYYFNKANLPNDLGVQDVWSFPARPRTNSASQTAPFPDELVERCLAVGCPPGGIVLDPFCGSGTTMRVALDRGHQAIGIELNEEFCRNIHSDLKALVE